MDSLEVRPLDGSEMAAHAPPFFWSPDSKFIAFDAGGALKKLNIAGGAAQTLCELAAPAIGGSWSRNGDIILGNVRGGILRVPENGGTPTEITSLDPAREEDSHLLPTFLPDGRHFVYLRVSRSKPALSGSYVGDLNANPREQEAQRLLPYAIGLTYVPSSSGPVGRLLFVQEGNLMAQPFDQDRRTLAGDASLVAEGVGVYLDGAFFSASVNNVLVYRRVDPDLPLTWIDRQGNAIGLAADAVAVWQRRAVARRHARRGVAAGSARFGDRGLVDARSDAKWRRDEIRVDARRQVGVSPVVARRKAYCLPPRRAGGRVAVSEVRRHVAGATPRSSSPRCAAV